MKIRFVLGICCVTLAGYAAARGDDFDARARQIVSQMTLDEKVSQMHGTSSKKGETPLYRVVVGVPRLGIPDLLVTNGPAGFGPAGPGHSSKATALPSPLSLAATWDVEAARQYGVVAGAESADFGNTLLEAPDVNIARVPQNGRTFEAYGEDPFLVGKIAVANIQGIQSQGIIANVKHFAANNQETDRLSIDAQVDERTLREIYLPAFEAAVKQGQVASIMGAYNRLNGAFCCENAPLLNDILKKEWGFDGFVTSDFGAVHSTVDTVTNGLDVEMPGGTYLGKPLKEAVDAGKVPVAVIDEHLIRRFRTMMKIGVWDHPPERKAIPEAQDAEIAKKLGEEGTVLLRNEGALLPLQAESLKSILLVGPLAGKAVTGGRGSAFVTPLHKVSPLEGLQKRLGENVKITVLDGKDIPTAVAAAKDADAAIVMLGSVEGEGHDRTIALEAGQDDLATAIAGANKRTVVILTSGGPALMPWAEKVPAILEAWYPGEEDGNVLAAVLLGDSNPSGKLPITFPKSLDDVPAHTPEQYPGTGEKHKEIEKYSEGVLVGYRWYDAQKIEPLYPFGFGLSYTSFEYKNLKLSTEKLSTTAPALTVDFDIINTGKRDGAEIAQVYVAMPAPAGVIQPPRQLKGFTRISVSHGQTAHASITLDARAFSYWDITTHTWKIAPGDYSIEVGKSSREIVLTGNVKVAAE